MNTQMRNLELQRAEFSHRKFLAMPLAGTIVWILIGISGAVLPTNQTILITFIGTGSIVYLGMLISKLTGENFIDKRKPKNTFDTLFLLSVGMSVLVYSIAIPFFLVDNSSLPLTVGILTGLMWMPFSWIIQHWIGVFHSVVRTVSIVALWYLFPTQRFTLIPLVIVAIYVVTIVVLVNRKKIAG